MSVFLYLVKKYCEIYGLLVYAYCIMLNHYHLLVDDPFGHFSDCMRDIQARYAEYYNQKYDRSGHVFQGPFGSCVVNGLAYITALIRYILRNPVKAKIVDSVWKYEWSSLGKSNLDTRLVDNNLVDIIFQNANKDFASFIENNEDDHKISAIEKKKFQLDEAITAYEEILLRITQTNNCEFSKLDVDIKMKIIMECRYLGITIKQLKNITGTCESFIRRANPRDMIYL